MDDFGATYLDRTYDEAKELLAQARDYMDTHEPIERSGLDPVDALRAVSEGLRMTSRLTEVMTWSMTQQALHAGEMTREEASAPHRRLGGQRICAPDSEEDAGELPPRLTNLLRRSLALYRRAQRLDRLAAGEDMQFGSFQVCLASELAAPPREHPTEPLPQRFLLA